MRLYLIRHPRPLIESGICYGSSDVHVADEEVQRSLLKLLPALPRHARVFSSPLSRCGSLAEKIAESIASSELRFDARLAEMHFGDWEMRAWEEISRAEVDAWAADLIRYRPGGGENVLQIAQRVKTFYEDLPKASGEQIVVVCHAGTIRLLLACLEGLSLEAMAMHAASTIHAIGYGELLVRDCPPAD